MSENQKRNWCENVTEKLIGVRVSVFAQKIIAGLVGIICALAFLSTIIGNVNSHEYVIKQAFITGKLSDHMTPGWYLKMFGKINTFNKMETVYFSKPDISGKMTSGGKEDWSIPVIFSDNSKCDISGTVRITMPVDGQKAIEIVSKYSNRTFDDFELKNIMPLIRRALIVSASTMTAPDGKRRMADIAAMSQDQLNNGIYQLISEIVKVDDPVTGEQVNQTLKRIRYNEAGQPIRVFDDMPLINFGVDARNFTVAEIICSDVVERQISEQQQAQMGIATAKARAAQAEQAKITVEREGDVRIAQIQKDEEAKSMLQIVQADRDKQVAVIEAGRQVEVALRLVAEERALLEAANLNAQRVKVTADAEAYARAKVLQADNKLQDRLDAWVKVNQEYAKSLAQIKLPSVMMINGDSKGGSSSNVGDITAMIQMLSAKAARDLAIDMNVIK